MKKIILILACTVCAVFNSNAQAPKFGYINSQELLVLMPEFKKADNDLTTYTKSFQDQLETMNKEYIKKVQEYQAQEKTMSDAVKEVKQKEIQDLQNRFESTQKSAEEKVAQKKQDLFKPILDKADKAIKDVAKEKGYDYIFDAAGGFLLAYKESDNVLPLVKTKLGIQ